MLTIEDAMNILRKHDIEKVFTIKSGVDIGDRYVFCIDFKTADPQRQTPGLPMVCVNKETGEITDMTIPPMENLDILNRGKDIEI